MRREDIINFLRINQVAESASDDEIRKTLTDGRWHARDVETALLILRGKKSESGGMSVASAVVHSDVRPSPDTIASMLGLNVSLKNIRNKHAAITTPPSFLARALHAGLVLVVSALIAVGAGMVLMYIFDIGMYNSFS